nr:sterile alpha motif domain-containing protein 1-like isoform X2 [Kogia breviceps]
MERGEPGRMAARSRGMEGHRPPRQGRRVSATRARLRTYRDLGNPPCSPGLRGTYTPKVRVVPRRGIRARRLPAAHPVRTPTRRAGHGGLGSLAGRLGSPGRAREGLPGAQPAPAAAAAAEARTTSGRGRYPARPLGCGRGPFSILRTPKPPPEREPARPPFSEPLGRWHPPPSPGLPEQINK